MDKPLLALETSDRLCGVAVYFDDNNCIEQLIMEDRAHSRKLLPTVDAVLKAADIQLSDLGGIVVSAGPGSFTGLRIGYSVAKSLAMGAGLPMLPVPTFDALAFEMRHYLAQGETLAIANKVNTTELYIGRFRKTEDGIEKTEDLHLEGIGDFRTSVDDSLVCGNIDYISNFRFVPKSAPSPAALAGWAAASGADLLTFDYDWLEPNYLKDFVVKEKQK